MVKFAARKVEAHINTIVKTGSRAEINRFAPVIHEESGRFWAEIPAMPGCYSEGDTPEEVRKNIIEAAQGWIEAKLQWFMQRMSAGETAGGRSRKAVFA